MDLLNLILDNALLTSVIIFPLGNVMLFGMVKVMLFPKTNPGQIMKDLLSEYRKHVQAEVIMTERLTRIDTKGDTVEQGMAASKAKLKIIEERLETVNANLWDFRREVDVRLDDVKEFRTQSHSEHANILKRLPEHREDT